MVDNNGGNKRGKSRDETLILLSLLFKGRAHTRSLKDNIVENISREHILLHVIWSIVKETFEKNFLTRMTLVKY